MEKGWQHRDQRTRRELLDFIHKYGVVATGKLYMSWSRHLLKNFDSLSPSISAVLYVVFCFDNFGGSKSLPTKNYILLSSKHNKFDKHQHLRPKEFNCVKQLRHHANDKRNNLRSKTMTKKLDNNQFLVQIIIK